MDGCTQNLAAGHSSPSLSQFSSVYDRLIPSCLDRLKLENEIELTTRYLSLLSVDADNINLSHTSRSIIHPAATSDQAKTQRSI